MRKPQLTQKPPSWRTGQQVSAVNLQKTTGAVQNLVGSINAGQIDLSQKRSISRAYFFVEFGPNLTTDQDWIACVEMLEDGNTASTNVRIALPFLLRRSPFDGGTRAGITYTYTDNKTRMANDGGGDVEEIIVPSFELGDMIFAHEVYPHARVREDVTDPSSLWIDLLMENDGRMWSRDANTSGGT